MLKFKYSLLLLLLLVGTQAICQNSFSNNSKWTVMIGASLHLPESTIVKFDDGSKVQPILAPSLVVGIERNIPLKFIPNLDMSIGLALNRYPEHRFYLKLKDTYFTNGENLRHIYFPDVGYIFVPSLESMVKFKYTFSPYDIGLSAGIGGTYVIGSFIEYLFSTISDNGELNYLHYIAETDEDYFLIPIYTLGLKKQFNYKSFRFFLGLDWVGSLVPYLKGTFYARAPSSEILEIPYNQSLHTLRLQLSFPLFLKKDIKRKKKKRSRKV